MASAASRITVACNYYAGPVRLEKQREQSRPRDQHRGNIQGPKEELKPANSIPTGPKQPSTPASRPPKPSHAAPDQRRGNTREPKEEELTPANNQTNPKQPSRPAPDPPFTLPDGLKYAGFTLDHVPPSYIAYLEARLSSKFSKYKGLRSAVEGHLAAQSQAIQQVQRTADDIDRKQAAQSQAIEQVQRTANELDRKQTAHTADLLQCQAHTEGRLHQRADRQDASLHGLQNLAGASDQRRDEQHTAVTTMIGAGIALGTSATRLGAESVNINIAQLQASTVEAIANATSEAARRDAETRARFERVEADARAAIISATREAIVSATEEVVGRSQNAMELLESLARSTEGVKSMAEEAKRRDARLDKVLTDTVQQQKLDHEAIVGATKEVVDRSQNAMKLMESLARSTEGVKSMAEEAKQRDARLDKILADVVQQQKLDHEAIVGATKEVVDRSQNARELLESLARSTEDVRSMVAEEAKRRDARLDEALADAAKQHELDLDAQHDRIQSTVATAVDTAVEKFRAVGARDISKQLRTITECIESHQDDKALTASLANRLDAAQGQLQDCENRLANARDESLRREHAYERSLVAAEWRFRIASRLQYVRNSTAIREAAEKDSEAFDLLRCRDKAMEYMLGMLAVTVRTIPCQEGDESRPMPWNRRYDGEWPWLQRWGRESFHAWDDKHVRSMPHWRLMDRFSDVHNMHERLTFKDVKRSPERQLVLDTVLDDLGAINLIAMFLFTLPLPAYYPWTTPYGRDGEGTIEPTAYIARTLSEGHWKVWEILSVLPKHEMGEGETEAEYERKQSRYGLTKRLVAIIESARDLFAPDMTSDTLPARHRQIVQELVSALQYGPR